MRPCATSPSSSTTVPTAPAGWCASARAAPPSSKGSWTLLPTRSTSAVSTTDPRPSMRYLPHTDDEIRVMLERIGVADIDALFAPIPESYRLKRPLALEPALDEAQLMGHLEDLANK